MGRRRVKRGKSKHTAPGPPKTGPGLNTSPVRPVDPVQYRVPMHGPHVYGSALGRVAHVSLDRLELECNTAARLPHSLDEFPTVGWLKKAQHDLQFLPSCVVMLVVGYFEPYHVEVQSLTPFLQYAVCWHQGGTAVYTHSRSARTVYGERSRVLADGDWEPVYAAAMEFASMWFSRAASEFYFLYELCDYVAGARGVKNYGWRR